MVRTVFNTKKITTLAFFRNHVTYLEPLSDREMKNLCIKQNLDTFAFLTPAKNKVYKDKIYLFGDIDFNNETDIKFIERYSKEILNPDSNANFYYSTFDYDEGTIVSEKGSHPPIFKRYNLYSDVVKWFKYHYCLIGKPKYFIIYDCKRPIYKDVNGTL